MFSRCFNLALAAAAAFAASTATAAPIIVGNSGIATANGDVTAPPADGPTYRYVSTFGGATGGGQIDGVGGSNGSSYTTDVFSANAGSVLSFYFNFITSDGAGFSDYAWSALVDSSGTAVVDYIFSARTTPTGDTVPGFGLPGLNAVLTPGTSPIIAGATNWAQLGPDSSGACFQGPGQGCGSTGWIQAVYTIADAGNYRVSFGATNISDTSFDTGLAFTSSIVDGEVIDPTPAIPEPATWAMLIAGFGLVGAAARRRRGLAVSA